jgi:hypothetical protein
MAKPEIQSQNSVPAANLALPRKKSKPISHRAATTRIIQLIMAAKIIFFYLYKTSIFANENDNYVPNLSVGQMGEMIRL